MTRERRRGRVAALVSRTTVPLPTVAELAGSAAADPDLSLGGEEKRVFAALTSLSCRHPDNVVIDVARETLEAVRVTVASAGGCFTSRASEISLLFRIFDEEGCVRPQNVVLWTTSGTGVGMYRYELPAAPAARVIVDAMAGVAMLRLLEAGVVPSFEVDGYLDPDWEHNRPLDWQAYRALGLVFLRDRIHETTNKTEASLIYDEAGNYLSGEVELTPFDSDVPRFITAHDPEPVLAEDTPDPAPTSDEDSIPAWEAALLASVADDDGHGR